MRRPAAQRYAAQASPPSPDPTTIASQPRLTPLGSAELAQARHVEGVLGLLALATYSALGNFAIFFQIATAVRLDGNQRRVRLLPLNQLGFLVSMVVIARATVSQWIDGLLERQMHWDKTRRYRKPGAPA